MVQSSIQQLSVASPRHYLSKVGKIQKTRANIPGITLILQELNLHPVNKKMIVVPDRYSIKLSQEKIAYQNFASGSDYQQNVLNFISS